MNLSKLRKEQVIRFGSSIQRFGRRFNPSGYTLDNYQMEASATAAYPEGMGDLKDPDPNLLGILYTALGLTGESGEYADKVKKIIRDNDGHISDEARLAIAKELGDVAWYLSQASYQLGFSLSEIAEMNREKLFSRKERGTIQGSGDNR